MHQNESPRFVPYLVAAVGAITLVGESRFGIIWLMSHSPRWAGRL